MQEILRKEREEDQKRQVEEVERRRKEEEDKREVEEARRLLVAMKVFALFVDDIKICE